MGANSSSQRQKRRRSQSCQHYPSRGRRHSAGSTGRRHSAGSTGGGSLYGFYTGGGGSGGTGTVRVVTPRQSRHQQRYYSNNSYSRASSLASLNHPDNMASTSSQQRRNAKSASTRTLLDKKCIFLGRYFARQFSQPVLQRLRFHVQRAKGTKTRIRLSTKGLTVGSKNSNVFKLSKAPYEFLPMDDIHEIFVDNELRNVLLVIKGLPDGHLELLTYRLMDELEARLYQQTFNEMVAMSGSRANQHFMQRVMESSEGTGTLQRPSSAGGHRSGYENNYATATLNSGTLNRSRTGNSWGRGSAQQNEAYVYRLKSDEHGSAPGTPHSRRPGKSRHRSEGDALDEELRKQVEDREFMAAMRARDYNDNIEDNGDDPDGGPIRLVFNKNGIIQSLGTASITRGDGESSYIGSDHDSGIQSKGTGQPDIVDSGLGTVRAFSAGSSNNGYSTSRSNASHTSNVFHESLDYTDHHGNGYVTSGRASRSPTRAASSTGGHVIHTVRRSESPAPSHHSKAQSEGGWKLRLPWKRRSRSSDSRAGHVWETTSLMVGTHPRPLGTMHLPNKSNEKTPPEFIVMYPSLNKPLNKGHRTRSKSASRFEL